MTQLPDEAIGIVCAFAATIEIGGDEMNPDGHEVCSSAVQHSCRARLLAMKISVASIFVASIIDEACFDLRVESLGSRCYSIRDMSDICSSIPLHYM